MFKRKNKSYGFSNFGVCLYYVGEILQRKDIIYKEDGDCCFNCNEIEVKESLIVFE